MTDVSVIIPTYNRASLVIRAVASVLYQTFTDYEIILVDDGSRDRTSDSLAPLIRHIRYLRHHSNRGVSAARNTGIKASRSPLVAFLDSDDYWLPEKLSVQMDFFMHHLDAVACQTEEFWIRNGTHVNPRRKHLKPSGDIFESSLKLCLVSPSSVMLRRSLFSEVGLFDENLPACEDYDLWLRISCRYPISLIPRRLVVKEGGQKDQLSRRVKGMDRFRITALLKLINGGQLSAKQLRATVQELSEKCRIYGNGCLKRGRIAEGKYYLELPKSISA
ncbi:MAG: glycosyltransferase family 2 protein [Deltaproteobacteria bacterium]|nr:glycosyltransferase family 2 protein [Deltaproteobacteria bacterium]